MAMATDISMCKPLYQHRRVSRPAVILYFSTREADHTEFVRQLIEVLERPVKLRAIYVATNAQSVSASKWFADSRNTEA